MKKHENYIAGKWMSVSQKTIDVVNPYTEKKIAEIVDSNDKHVYIAVKAAREKTL